jgi:predicted RNA-binding protein with PUA-like domain
MKSEPSVYSIDDLARDGSTCWEGVRNYQARNLMREMKLGDLVLYYHSNADPPGVVGVARVCREAYPDRYSWNKRSKYYDAKSTKENPRWYMVNVEFVEKWDRLVPLDALKVTRGLEDMVVTKRSRLSVQPVKKKEFEIVRKLGRR